MLKYVDGMCKDTVMMVGFQELLCAECSQSLFLSCNIVPIFQMSKES